ncbi:MAG: thymidylate synthase [Candidatus Saccharimonadales bacterium]
MEKLKHIDPVEYRENREPDYQYQELLKRIVSNGRITNSGMDEESKQVLGHIMYFDLENGFPMITERDLMESIKTNSDEYVSDLSERHFRMSARQGLGEIIGFINGARTVEELEKYGNKWWKLWATPEKCAKRGLEPGDLGPGSYGAAFHDFPMANGETFNQFAAIIQQIKERPELRTHIITPYIPYNLVRIEGQQQKVVVVPCHGDLRFDIDTERQELSLVHKQRSADTPVGLPFNMIHYTALMTMMGQATGYRPKELVYMIDNAHIYKRHYDKALEVIDRSPKPFPKLKVDPSVKNIFDFRVEHFTIEGYDAHPPIDMEGTPI